MISEVVIGVMILVGTVLSLSMLVLVARRWLVPSGIATITINDSRMVSAAVGDKLIWALAASGVLLPAACGGRGSCGQCQIRVVSGGGKCLPNEIGLLSRRAIRDGDRLACMVTVRGDLAVQVKSSALEVQRWNTVVESNRNVTAYLKELVVRLQDNSRPSFQAGDYMLLEAPAGKSAFAEFQIDKPYQAKWAQFGFRNLTATREQSEVRAYSIASPPHVMDTVAFIVRIAVPPPGAAANTPPGRVSSYLFGLQPGDALDMSGPFGEFHARDSSAEMIFIGGGAGLAPLRSIILDQLVGKRTTRKMSLWYGVRDVDEICFADEFDALQSEHDNFTWHVALSDATESGVWAGLRGLVHSVVYEQYLSTHSTPNCAEYYLCGPPLMASAVLAMLEDIGVSQDNIFLDSFGA